MIVGVLVIVGVSVIVGVNVRVGVLVGVRVIVGVLVMVGVFVIVGVLVMVGVFVGVDVKLSMLPINVQLPQPGKLKVRVTDHMPEKAELLNRAIQDTFAPSPSIGRAGGVDEVLMGDC